MGRPYFANWTRDAKLPLEDGRSRKSKARTHGTCKPGSVHVYISFVLYSVCNCNINSEDS